MATSLSLPPSLAPSKPLPIPQPNHPNYPLLLENCATFAHLKQIHAHMIRSGLVFSPLPASHLISTCTSSAFSSPDYARLVFSLIPNPTTFTSNSIIRSYTNLNSPTKALCFYIHLFENGHIPDTFTFPSLFKSCRDPRLGRQLHCHVIKFGLGLDTYIQNTLMGMYSACGCLGYARLVFDRMPDKTVVSWATMIAGYAKWADPVAGLELYRRMVAKSVEPNEIVLVNVLTACARARDLEAAKEVRRYMRKKGIKSNVVLGAALLDVYCKCGRVLLARKLFDEMPAKNLFCWNIMIKGHVEDGNYKEALHLFRVMHSKEGMRGDQITMASLVLACAHLGAIELGKSMHLYIQQENIEVDVVLGTALVDMYSKCGCIETALKVFDEIPCRNVATWTALIGGLAISGHEESALLVFEKMKKSGVQPDAVTFIGVLTACSHAGLLDRGHFYFDSMSEAYNVDPTMEHYRCMVDVLGRAGLIEKAEDLIVRMPVAPDYSVLVSLLNACRIYRNLEVAERTANRILELNSKNGGVYVLLSNMYASLKNWDESNRIRNLMVEKKIRQPRGCSMIEVGGEVHEFVLGDVSHPRSAEVNAMVEEMIQRLKASGYVSNKPQGMFDMDEEEKEEAVCRRHSEKLAVSFGLISVGPGVPIRVVKNLRMCGACHAETEMIAEAYGREIVVRDSCRFHHFRDGSCSCKDFW